MLRPSQPECGCGSTQDWHHSVGSLTRGATQRLGIVTQGLEKELLGREASLDRDVISGTPSPTTEGTHTGARMSPRRMASLPQCPR